MPARDSRPEQVDSPAIASEHEAFIRRIEERQQRMGLDVQVNHGGTLYAPSGEAASADTIEANLRVSEVPGGAEGNVYAIGVNRGGMRPADALALAQRERSRTIVSDTPLPPGTPPILHDPTGEARREAVRGQGTIYTDRRIGGDETLGDEPFPGVVLHRPAPMAMPEPDATVLYSDRVAGPVGSGVVLATSETANAAERVERTTGGATLLGRDHDALAAQVAELGENLPARSEEAAVDEAGRTVTTTYLDRAAKAREVRAAQIAERQRAAAPRVVSPIADEPLKGGGPPKDTSKK